MEKLRDGQIDVLRELAKGYPQEEIAERLGTTLNTVKSRIASMNRKLGTNGAPSAIAKGYLLGYLDPPGIGDPDPKLDLDLVKVLVMIARGYSNGETAQELNLTPYQLKYRIKKLYEILEAKNNCHLVSLGFQTRNLVLRPKR